MNYELAKKLKDAGFPQITKDGFNVTTISAGGTHFPTLSELIEACGIWFECMYRRCGKTIHETKEWAAIGFAPFTGFDSLEKKDNPVGIGSTPEAAVAELYLKLNPVKALV